MRTRLVFLLASACLLVPPVTAAAAVPRRPADEVLACGDTDPAVVRVWNSKGRFAVKNACRSNWLVISVTPWESESGVTTISVARGAHFNWRGEVATTANEDNLDTTYRWTIQSGPEYCAPDGSEAVLRGSRGRAVDVSEQCADAP